MTVKVIAERSVNPGSLDEAVALLTDLRTIATRQPGYVSGETLFSVDRPGAHAVISTWESLSNWHSWETSPQRRDILKRIDARLSSPSRTSVFETARHVTLG